MKLHCLVNWIAKYRSIIALTICILALLSFSLSVFEGSTGRLYKWDDTEHLTVAYNLIHGNGLTTDYISGGAKTPDVHISELSLYSGVSHPLWDKGPIYVLLLAPWMWLTSTNPDIWVFWGTVFNTLLSICLVCVYFFWTKKTFGFWIGATSTFVLATLPFVFLYASRIVAEPLFGIILLSAFYFKKTNLTKWDALITGVLVGLAHLTHGVGIILGASILLLFIIKRYYKFALLFVLSWGAILSPWLLRNYLLFGDPTLGLALPLSSLIKSILPPINAPYASISGGWQVALGTASQSNYLPPLELLSGFFNRLNSLYGMSFLTISVIILALLGFTLWFIFKVKRIDPKDPEATENSDFIRRRSDIYLLTAIYCTLAVFAYYSLSASNGGSIPEPRFIMSILFFLIPVAFAGLKEVFLWIPRKKIHKRLNSRQLLGVLGFLILFSLVIQSSASSVPVINRFQQYTIESPDQVLFHSWIRNNTSSGATLATNEPVGLRLCTGLSTVPLNLELFHTNATYLKWLNEKFSVRYFVLYNYQPNVACACLENDTYLYRVYSSGNNVVYEVVNDLPFTEDNSILSNPGSTASLKFYGNGSYSWLMSTESQNEFVSQSYEITRTSGDSGWYALDIIFSGTKNYTGNESLYFWLYGNSSQGTNKCYITAPDWSNYFQAAFSDGFIGWRLITISLNEFSTASGNPNWETVKTVRVLDGVGASCLIVGNIAID